MVVVGLGSSNIAIPSIEENVNIDKSAHTTSDGYKIGIDDSILSYSEVLLNGCGSNQFFYFGEHSNTYQIGMDCHKTDTWRPSNGSF